MGNTRVRGSKSLCTSKDEKPRKRKSQSRAEAQGTRGEVAFVILCPGGSPWEDVLDPTGVGRGIPLEVEGRAPYFISFHVCSCAHSLIF